MSTTKKLHLLGVTLFFLFIIFAQMLWILDTLRFKGRSLYWIDVLEFVLYFGAVIPLIWAIAAALGLYRFMRLKYEGGIWYRLLSFLKGGILISALSTIFLIAVDQGALLLIVSILGLTFLLVLADLLVNDSPVIQWSKAGLFSVTSALALCVFLLFPTSYSVTYPGLTMNMNKYAQVIGGESRGEIMSVLIFERPAFPVDWLYAKWLPHYDLKPRRETDLPLREQLERVGVLKLDADQVASAIAFQTTGIGQGLTTHGALITGLLSGTPAAQMLQVGDVIINMNGHAVSSVHDFMQLMSSAEPGMDIHLTIVRSSEEIVFITQTHYDPEEHSRAILGAQIVDDIRYDLPHEVVFYSYLLHRGGPSHGAMLALSIINQLSPNGVTNGNIVAGTGTIRNDGSIGRIGGVKQKAYSAERTGADVFFVPESQYEEALAGVQHLTVVPVQTLDDILAWLEANPK